MSASPLPWRSSCLDGQEPHQQQSALHTTRLHPTALYLTMCPLPLSFLQVSTSATSGSNDTSPDHHRASGDNTSRMALWNKVPWLGESGSKQLVAIRNGCIQMSTGPALLPSSFSDLLGKPKMCGMTSRPILTVRPTWTMPGFGGGVWYVHRARYRGVKRTNASILKHLHCDDKAISASVRTHRVRPRPM